jgi:O-antigen/teichoic acid export membrane protein
MTGEARFPSAVRSVASRFGWGVADQALSSLTNFALGLLAAQVLLPQDFGAFALVFAAYLVALGAVRAVTSEPFVIRFVAVSSRAWKKGAASATGAALAISLVAGLGCVLAALILEGSLGSGFLALAVCMPGLLLQDTWRFTFFSRRRGSAAFLNDLSWAVILFAAVTLVLALGVRSVGWLVLAWGGAGSLAGLLGLFQASVVPVPRWSLRWVREQRDLVPRFLGEFGVTAFVAQVTVFGLGGLAGLEQAGAFRAGQLLLGPLNVVYLGVGIVAVPEGVRFLLLSAQRLLRFCRRLSVTLATVALVFGAAVWALPDRVGTALLRHNWSGAHAVVIPIAISLAGFALVLGAGVGLRALAAAPLSLRARLLAGPVLLTGGLGGAANSGASGAAWGLAFAMAGAAVIWWAHFLHGLKGYEGRAKAYDSTAEPIVEGRMRGLGEG